MLDSNQLRVPKTLKFFVDGKFIRTESGRSFPIHKHKSNELYAHLSRASRKDLRNAVEAAKKAHSGWASRSAFNRSQILYRAAEMTEGHRSEIVELLEATLGYDHDRAEESVDQAIDAFVYYSGFCDKFPQVLGAVNPVAGPHHNFTTPESIGVTALIVSENFNLGEVIAQMCAILCSGNTLVVLLHGDAANLLGPVSEIFATSDFPAGSVNLITGFLDELAHQIASHMEIDALHYAGSDQALLGELKGLGVPNMKRIAGATQKSHSLDNILNFVEFKTVWHPIGS